MLGGVYGKGMHEFVLDEAELGFRVASYLDSENNLGWTALDDVLCERDMAEDK